MTTESNKINENQHNIDKYEMHNILSLIAQELEQFHSNAITKNEIKTKLNILTTSPKSKQSSLNEDCNSEKCLQTDDDYNNLISKNEELKRENEVLTRIINISFQKLKTIRGESSDVVPDNFEQLKQLVICCGQYYADYCNESIKNTELQQRNNFLYNKTIILKTNILGLNEELKNIKYQNTRLKSELLYLKRAKISQKRYKFTFDENVIHDVDFTGDVQSHIELVKKLLLEQDYALKELSNAAKSEDH